MSIKIDIPCSHNFWKFVAALGCALFWAQVSCYSTQWAENKVTFLLEFGAWKDVDLSLDFGKVVAVCRFSCWRPLQFWRNFLTQIHVFPGHAPNGKRKVLPCSAHWALRDETWTQKWANTTTISTLPSNSLGRLIDGCTIFRLVAEEKALENDTNGKLQIEALHCWLLKS